MIVLCEATYLQVKYKDDGREFVSVLEFATIHCTFPLLNVWATYLLAYQVSSVIIQTCPYSERLTPQHFWCKEGYQNQSKELY